MLCHCRIKLLMTPLPMHTHHAQSGTCRWSTSTFKNSCRWITLDMPESRGTTEQIHWQAKQPSEVACFSEDLKHCEAGYTTCGYKAKDITPSITWRREAWKEEALNTLPWKNERGPPSIRRTLEPFQRHCWGNWDRVVYIWSFLSAWTPSWTELNRSRFPADSRNIPIPRVLATKLAQSHMVMGRCKTKSWTTYMAPICMFSPFPQKIWTGLNWLNCWRYVGMKVSLVCVCCLAKHWCQSYFGGMLIFSGQGVRKTKTDVTTTYASPFG